MKAIPLAAFAALLMLAGGALAEDEPAPVSPAFDAALAESLGADDYGMRQYVLVILAVSDLEEAAALVATDPVVMHGEMVAEYHAYYGSAALMLVNDAHAKVAMKGF